MFGYSPFGYENPITPLQRRVIGTLLLIAVVLAGALVAPGLLAARAPIPVTGYWFSLLVLAASPWLLAIAVSLVLAEGEASLLSRRHVVALAMGVLVAGAWAWAMA